MVSDLFPWPIAFACARIDAQIVEAIARSKGDNRPGIAESYIEAWLTQHPYPAEVRADGL